MMYGLAPLIDICVKNGLKIEEHFVLELLYFKTRIDPDLGNAYMQKYADAVGVLNDKGNKSVAPKSVILSLVERGWIVKSPDKGYILNMDAVKHLFLDVETAGDEFYDAYPSFTTINEKSIVLKLGDRWGNYMTYWRLIKGNQDEHAEVIKDILYGVKYELINMGITKFIEAMFWREIRRKRKVDNAIHTKGGSLLADNDFYNG